MSRKREDRRLWVMEDVLSSWSQLIFTIAQSSHTQVGGRDQAPVLFLQPRLLGSSYRKNTIFFLLLLGHKTHKMLGITRYVSKNSFKGNLFSNVQYSGAQTGAWISITWKAHLSTDCGPHPRASTGLGRGLNTCIPNKLLGLAGTVGLRTALGKATVEMS